ncbi:MAG: hypothetical protein EPN48_18115, partial [Microbacteriaceae bacterium]
MRSTARSPCLPPRTYPNAKLLTDTLPHAETLELFPSLGLQLASRTVYHFTFPFTSASPPAFRSSRHTRLVPLERIDKVIINEGLQGAGGRHYLAVVERASVGAEGG